jgi:uracil phosphoribosyltransferase
MTAGQSYGRNVTVLDHPLIQHKLTKLRDRTTSVPNFRRLLKEIALLMGYEVTRNLPLSTRRIETPVGSMEAPVIVGEEIAVVPILRAGLGMADGLLELLPTALVGHIGVYRDPETHLPHEYYVKLPKPESNLYILVDPMLATGNSAVHAVDVMNKHGIADGQIRFMVLVAAPEGIRNFHARHPDVPIVVAAVDERLNDKAYILPGLGDAGDRIFGTL